MTSIQKVIKYLAIAFAIFLIVTIISTTTAAIFALSGILGLKQDIEFEKVKIATGAGETKIQNLNIANECEIDGKELTNGEFFGNGENYIEVDGVVGNIKIDFVV